MGPEHEPGLLEVRGLHTHFYTDEGVVRAVNGVTSRVGAGPCASWARAGAASR